MSKLFKILFFALLIFLTVSGLILIFWPAAAERIPVLAGLNAQSWAPHARIPVAIFLARIVDVSIGTLRTVFTSRGHKNIAPLLGFVEVLIWVSVVSQISRGMQSPAVYLAYAGGYAAGNFVGLSIEKKLAIGVLAVRFFVPGDAADILTLLNEKGFGATIVDGRGSQGPVSLVYTIIRRRHLQPVLSTIRTRYPDVFFTVEDVRTPAVVATYSCHEPAREFSPEGAARQEK